MFANYTGTENAALTIRRLLMNVLMALVGLGLYLYIDSLDD